MPRATRKRKLLHPNRSQLLFVEQPKSGSTHNYGEQIRSAVNPRSVISEQTRQGGPDHSWVSSQFTSLEDMTVRYKGQRKKKKNHQLPFNSLNRTLPSTRVNATICKYPTLLFAPSNPIPSGRHRGLDQNSIGVSTEIRSSPNQTYGTIAPVSRDETRSPVTSGAGIFPKPTSSSTPNTSSILTPPCIQTPEIAPLEHAAPSCLLFSPNQSRTPPRTADVLVRDTPESDYGLRVTWRRRKHFMRLLTKRGTLLHTDAMTSMWWPECV